MEKNWRQAGLELSKVDSRLADYLEFINYQSSVKEKGELYCPSREELEKVIIIIDEFKIGTVLSVEELKIEYEVSDFDKLDFYCQILENKKGIDFSLIKTENSRILLAYLLYNKNKEVVTLDDLEGCYNQKMQGGKWKEKLKLAITHLNRHGITVLMSDVINGRRIEGFRFKIFY